MNSANKETTPAAVMFVKRASSGSDGKVTEN